MHRPPYPSDSSRATTAAESRFRLDRPNSRKRTIRIVALDPASEDLAIGVARDLTNASPLTLPAEARRSLAHLPKSLGGSGDAALDFRGLSPEGRAAVDALTSADMVVMVTRAGDDASAAAFIAEACWPLGVATTGLVVAENGDAEEAATSETLRQLRPHAFILAVTTDLEFVDSLVQALAGGGA